LGVGFLGQGQYGGPVLGIGALAEHDLREVGHRRAAGAVGQGAEEALRHQFSDAGWWRVVFHVLTLSVLMLMMTKLLDISSSKQEKSSERYKKSRRKNATACP